MLKPFFDYFVLGTDIDPIRLGGFLLLLVLSGLTAACRLWISNAQTIRRRCYTEERIAQFKSEPKDSLGKAFFLTNMYDWADIRGPLLKVCFICNLINFSAVLISMIGCILCYLPQLRISALILILLPLATAAINLILIRVVRP